VLKRRRNHDTMSTGKLALVGDSTSNQAETIAILQLTRLQYS
jgi:hypothetical protein